jgi:ABC-type amino acid transport substrate-binding protein
MPETKFVILPESSSVAEMLTSVADRKADLAFLTPTVFKSFDRNSPGVLKRVATDTPFYVFNVSFGIKPDEPAFKNLLDYMIRNMIENGTLADLYKKYDPDGLIYMPAPLSRPRL